MKNARTEVTPILMANLKALASHAKERGDLTAAAKRGGFTPKTLWNAANGRTKPTLKTLERMAFAFSVDAWQLLLPDFHVSVILDPQMPSVLRAYALADRDGRDMISRVAALTERASTK